MKADKARNGIRDVFIAEVQHPNHCTAMLHRNCDIQKSFSFRLIGLFFSADHSR